MKLIKIYLNILKNIFPKSPKEGYKIINNRFTYRKDKINNCQSLPSKIKTKIKLSIILKRNL